jgi:hypothetical protein
MVLGDMASGMALAVVGGAKSNKQESSPKYIAEGLG